MKGLLIAILAGFLVASTYSALNKPNLPYPFIECTENDDCAEHHCCTIGPQRYSFPSCQPRKALREVCRPDSKDPVSMTLGYPDGKSLHLDEVHYITCPCRAGLTCDAASGSCK